ncbi:MAG: amidase [Rhodospirillaceae bacterium]|nr:amidase [Rhodospirillaceae bacterium]MYF87043.1 amidase [Rhodospirillaceae bacterium]MYH39229.1 amidase [Rhodospirillaceae bacterium]MYK57097.1 amidase [Rhodospirillaceae bacterium]
MTLSDTARPIWQWSAPATAAAIRDGDISAAEAVEAHSARMDAANPALNAVVIDLREDARAAAVQADAALDAHRAAGKPLGVLHGVPVTVKINIDFKGQANTNGIAAFRDVIAPDDSPVVANLRKAGAIVLGLTNTPEFSFRAFTDNPLHGPTKNPWSPLHNPGGSSGGGGAAVAAGIGALAHGNDIGGSLRFPAWSNGLATIKPTLGRVPAYNPSAPAERPLMAQLMSVQGPMAREVASVRLGLEAMAARDWRDPFWCPVPFEGVPLEGPAPERPIRVLYAQPDDDMDCDPAVMAQVDAAAAMLADAGYAVEKGPAPRLKETWQMWTDILMAEVQTMQREIIDRVATPALTDTLDAYLAFSNRLDLKGYMTAIAQRSRHVREWMAQLEETPLILTPASVQPVNLLNEDLQGPQRVYEIFTAARFISALNLLGLPCAIAPVGTLNGLPNACQIVASRFREDLAFDAAQAIEDRVGVLCRELWAREG